MLSRTSSFSWGFKKHLTIIDPVKSVMKKVNIIFPVFVSIVSTLNTSPSTATYPEVSFISLIAVASIEIFLP